MEIQSDGPSPSRYEIVKARKEAEKERKESGGVIGVLHVTLYGLGSRVAEAIRARIVENPND